MINVIIHVIGGNNTNISALTKKLFLLQLIKNTLHLAVLLLYIISKCESSDLTDSEKNIGRGRHKYEIVIKPEAMQRKTEHEHKKPPKQNKISPSSRQQMVPHTVIFLEFKVCFTS